MRRIARASVVLVGTAVLAIAGGQAKGKKKTVPAVFANARYVYVVAEDGDVFRPGLLPEDRQAIADVMDALRRWNRYVLTPDRQGAELLFVVRKGRVASATLGGTVGTPGPVGQPRPGVGGPGVMAGGEVGPPDDLLEVRMLNQDGAQSAPVWQRSEPDGLNAPQVLLLGQLRDAVDKDYPQ